MNNRSDQPFEIFGNSTPLSGRCLIEASAGTGKTYNISGLFVRLIAENSMGTAENPAGIVVVTFTRAATKELRQRIAQRLRDAYLSLQNDTVTNGNDAAFLEQVLAAYTGSKRTQAIQHLDHALEQVDQLSVFTIHSFAQRLLQEFGTQANIHFSGDITTDDEEMLKELVYDYWRRLMARAESSEAHRHFFNVLQQRTTIDQFFKDFRSVFTDTHVRFGDEAADIENLYEQEQALLERWRDLQEQINDTIKADFWSLQRNESEALHGTKYNARHADTRMQSFEGFLDDDLAVYRNSLDEKLNYFCTSEIEAAVKKDNNWNELQLADETERYAETMDRFLEAFETAQYRRSQYLQRAIEQVREDFFRSMPDREQLSYDELLLMARQLIRNDRARRHIAGQYPVALIDEFQDTDPVQWDIFDELYPQEDVNQTLLYLIGDPKQSIFRFRGADIYSYLNARQTIPDERQFTLTTNYRSDASFIRAQNTLWNRHPDPFWSGQIHYRQVDAHFEDRSPLSDELGALHWVIDPAGEAELNKNEAIARAASITGDHIHKTLTHIDQEDASGAIKPGDIAVLCSAHKEAEQVKNALNKRGIDSVLISKNNIYDSPEARDLQWILEAVADPGNAPAVRRALGTELLGNADLLRQIHQAADSDIGPSERWEQWLYRFAGWHDRWLSDGLVAMLRSLIEEAGCIERLAAYHDGRRRITNLWHLVELLQQIAQERPGEIHYLLKQLRLKRNRDSGRPDEEEELRLESDRDLVKIVTIHSSKGLEYNIVYTPFLWSGISTSQIDPPYLIHPEHTDRKLIDLDGEQIEGSLFNYFNEEFQDRLRLTYVALTRAEYHHIIVQVPYSGTYQPGGRSVSFAPIDRVLIGGERYQQVLASRRSLASYIEADDPRAITYGEMITAVRDLVEESSGSMQIEEWQENEQLAHEPVANQRTRDSSYLEWQAFEHPGQLQQAWSISSYSSLKRGAQEEADTERYELEIDETVERKPAGNDPTIFNLPRGARMGLCWHMIFEEIRFDEPDSYAPAITRQLINHGFSERWQPVLLENLQTVMQQHLRPGADLCLHALAPEQLMREMEFHFGYSQADLSDIVGMIRGDGESLTSTHILPGLMKGFIDLTFEWNGRYYILDYKSNHLGDRIDDYHPDLLEDEMRQKFYDVQYHLYSLALHRYLHNRMGESYDYEHHFGGVIYLFMRGVQAGDHTHGIYFDRPDGELIQQLNAYFNREDVHAE